MSIPRGTFRVLATMVAVLLSAVCSVDADNSGLAVDCRLALTEESIGRDNIVVALDRSRTELDAAQQIFELFDGLWNNDAVERMLWLRARHDRDLGAVEVQLNLARLERQQRVLEQLRLACQSSTAEQDKRLDDAYEAYLDANCEVHKHRIASAEIELAFHREWLASVLELREHQVTARQDIIIAERDVEMSEKLLARSRERLAACRQTPDRPDAP